MVFSLPLQFWMLANYVYDPRQAKRLFPILGMGATLGGIVGGYITQYTAPLIGTENLLPGRRRAARCLCRDRRGARSDTTRQDS